MLLLIAAFGGLPEAIETNAAPAAAAEIPPDHLAVMRQVSNQTGIPWQILAAISKVESGFGANMGPSSAGAIGYCQFLPGTWAAYGVDGDGDGITRPSIEDSGINSNPEGQNYRTNSISNFVDNFR